MVEPGRVARGQVVEGKYQLVALVAKGEHGELWRGELRGAGGFARPVAIKVVPEERVRERLDAARFLARVRRSAVLDHANIVQVNDFARDRAGHYHIVMPWVDGLSLRELVRGIERLGLRTPWPVAVAIGVGVLRGLASAHAHVDVDGDPDPVLHGELSPDRILIGINGIARLGGYGLLGATRAGQAAAADVRGYQAPEVAQHAAWYVAADVFGVGAVLWEALAGRPPFGDARAADGFRAGTATLPSLGRVRPGLPSRLVAAIDRAVGRRAVDRFATADDMAGELAALLAGVGWQRGPQADLGGAVCEARAALGRASPGSDSADLFEIAPADIIGVVEVPEGHPGNPILLNHLAAEPLSDDDLLAVDDGVVVGEVVDSDAETGDYPVAAPDADEPIELVVRAGARAATPAQGAQV